MIIKNMSPENINRIKIYKKDDPTVLVLNNDIESALKELHKKTKNLKRFNSAKQNNKYSNLRQWLRRKQRFTVGYRKWDL
jgi:ribosomal protein S21